MFDKHNIKNSNNEIMFREYKYFYIYDKRKKLPKLNEYAIWCDDLNISHLRQSKNLFIDGTWYKPNGFQQILIIQYKDIIIKEKIVGAYLIMNNKKFSLYYEVLNAFKNIITQNGKYKLNIKSITSDAEKALIKAIKKIFPNILHFNCYFHYKKDIKDYLKCLGFTKKKNLNLYLKSKEIVNHLGLLPLEYQGNIEAFDKFIIDLKSKYPDFINFFNNYFIKYKRQFFVSGEYNYNNLPIDCRSNSYIENYNLYLKRKLGKKYNLSWNKFLRFIKNESLRFRNKLTFETNINIDYNSKKTKFGNLKYNPIDFIDENDNILNNSTKIKTLTKNSKENEIVFDNSVQLNSSKLSIFSFEELSENNKDNIYYCNFGQLTKFKWLPYKYNSCRYDMFITFYIFCIY